MNEEMTVEEKKDMLLEFLSDLYEIKSMETQENPTLERKIRILEKRLDVLGVTDLTDIRA